MSVHTALAPAAAAAGAAPAVPVAARFGDPGAAKHAVVLGPVSAAWDGGAFFAGVAGPLLERGHRITVYDTLSLLHDGDDFASLTARWAGVLAPEPPDVLAGNAFGGAVAQALLDRPWTHTAAVVLLSAPTVADTALDETLERIAHAAETRGPAAALALLAEVVRGPDAPPAAAEPGPVPGRTAVPAARSEAAPAAGPGSVRTADPAAAARRLVHGLRLLHRVDASRAVRAFPGPLMHVYGAASLLVGRQHLAAGAGHECHGVAGAGMRPHADRPEEVRALLAAFLTTRQSEKTQ